MLSIAFLAKSPEPAGGTPALGLRLGGQGQTLSGEPLKALCLPLLPTDHSWVAASDNCFPNYSRDPATSYALGQVRSRGTSTGVPLCACTFAKGRRSMNDAMDLRDRPLGAHLGSVQASRRSNLAHGGHKR